MNRKIIYHILALLMVVLLSCNQDEDCCYLQDYLELSGKWLLVERGYSPGSGYITEPVDPKTGLYIDFSDDGSFESNIQNLEIYRFFHIIENPQDDPPVLALFKARTGRPDNLDQLEHSYNIRLEENELTLFFRFCIEGCHLKFIKAADD